MFSATAFVCWPWPHGYTLKRLRSGTQSLTQLRIQLTNTMSAKKRIELSLDQKISLPKDNEKHSYRNLSGPWFIQICLFYNLSKGKLSTMEAFECNASPNRKGRCVRQVSHAE